MVQFYPKQLPDLGDLLVCQIESVHQDCEYEVRLLEYENLVGFVGLKEITQKKWFKNIRDLAAEGDIEVMEVIGFGDRGDIHLSRRHISDTSKEKAFVKYRQWKRVYDYLHHRLSQDMRDMLVQEVIHPFLRHSESVSDEEDDQLDPADPCIPLSSWLKEEFSNRHTENISILQQALGDIVNLVEKPPRIERCTDVIELRKLRPLRAGTVNKVLAELAETHRVDMKTENTKTMSFRVTTRDKMNPTTFEGLMAQIQKSLEERRDPWPDPEVDQEIQNSLDSTEPTVKSTVEPTGQRIDPTVQPIINIGVIGHVAHGKTTLIEAISGADTRKYKREIASNRTLNIGYTNATIAKCTCHVTSSTNLDGIDLADARYIIANDLPESCSCPQVTVSIVDCPGHNVLLPTMMSGAYIMDTCILVVAADEPCPRPQTQEHVAVLQIVGSATHPFGDGLVVQNKADLVTPVRVQEHWQEIRDFVDGTVFENAHILPASAQMKLNVEPVLEFIYAVANQRVERDREEKSCGDHLDPSRSPQPSRPSTFSKGIIVRTFDINKPGASTVRGAVIGGSILEGTLSVGDTLVLLPLALQATVLSLKTETTSLSTARPGGLIAIQTDINPSYCSQLVGCTFVLAQDFDPNRMLEAGSPFKFKYDLLLEGSVQRLEKDSTLTLHYNGRSVDAYVVKSAKDKRRGILSIRQPVYIHPNDDFTFAIMNQHHLLGYGRSLDHPSTNAGSLSANASEMEPFVLPPYPELLAKFQNQLKTWKENSLAKIRIPLPTTVYARTFTTVVNFDSICKALHAQPQELGHYIYQELGSKSFSINGQGQLILKGRSEQKNVISVLNHYIREKRCMLCHQNTVKTIRNMGVKQRVCTNCTWKE